MCVSWSGLLRVCLRASVCVCVCFDNFLLLTYCIILRICKSLLWRGRRRGVCCTFRPFRHFLDLCVIVFYSSFQCFFFFQKKKETANENNQYDTKVEKTISLTTRKNFASEKKKGGRNTGTR